jgi:predicted nuclease of restriction endonuclease-like (RecB) superfamily
MKKKSAAGKLPGNDARRSNSAPSETGRRSVASNLPETDDYQQFIEDLKRRVLSARVSAARAVTHEVILLYWDIGRGIVQKQLSCGWGDSVVELVAADLRRAFPDIRGFSPDSVWRMRQLYSEYSASDFLEQAVPESRGRVTRSRSLEPVVPKTHFPSIIPKLASRDEAFVAEYLAPVPWGHHIEIMKKVKEPAARLWYLRATAQFGWSRNVLLNQIKAGAFERAVKEKKSHNFDIALPEHFAEQADEMLKSTYSLDFLGLTKAVRERELEDRLITRLQAFLLELGYGFCFIGRQYRLTLGKKDYFLDLLFYHRFLKCLVAFELKVGPFEPEHAGQMDFYLNLLNDKERNPGDQPSIGIILCAEKDDVEVEYALKSKSNPIGVAAYELQSKLPGDMKGKLPSTRQLVEVVRFEMGREDN